GRPRALEPAAVSRAGRVLVGHHTKVSTLMGTAPGDPKERDLSWLDDSNAVDISSDGTKLLVAEEGEGGGPAFATYLRATDGSPPVRLGDGYPGALSRDGAWVVVETNSTQSSRKPQLVLLQTGAGESRPLANDTLENFAAVNWMPDGKRLVICGNEPGHKPRIWIQDVAGGKPRPITAAGVSMSPFGTPVSPDGSLVVGDDAESGAVLCPTAGGDPRRIPGWKTVETAVQWSLDGKALYAGRLAEIPMEIFRIDVATGERSLWKEIRPSDPRALGIEKFVMTRDGSAYAYSCYHYSSELYVIDGLR